MKVQYLFLFIVLIVGCQKDEIVDRVDFRTAYMGNYSIHFYQRSGDSLFIDSMKVIDTSLTIHFMYNKNEFVQGIYFDTIPQRAIHMISFDTSVVPNQVFQMFETGALKIDPGFTFPEFVGDGGFIDNDSIDFYAESIGGSKFFEQRINGHKLK